MQDNLLRRVVDTPSELKKLDKKQTGQLCQEIRDELINTVSKTGGHLASNLGAVELTVALHKNFNLPKDKIVFDVGHQCYVHKMLSGRLSRFDTLRQKDGISGFPRPSESEYDAFSAGHSSTSVSAAFGIAEAKRERREGGYVVAVVGDGAISGGLVYEGLNNAGRSKDKLIVILNDNKMSISKNVGAMSRYLAKVRSKKGYHRFKSGFQKILMHIPFIGEKCVRVILKIKKAFKSVFFTSTIFEDFGFSYLGPIDGHDSEKLDFMLTLAKNDTRPVVLHINTVKGKGYSFAEKIPSNYHGVNPFDIETGESAASGPNFSKEFGQALVSFAEKDKRICAITAAMRDSTGLIPFSEKFKSRFYDVGIAEEHAVTFASGLSISGMVPFFAVYSTFLQRAYDMIIHDAALQNLKVVFGIDRAGIVGADGETHQGVFDVAFLNSIPNVTVYSPATFDELRYDMKCAIYNDEGVVAIRYPRGNQINAVLPEPSDYYVLGNLESDSAIVTYGRELGEVLKANETLNVKIIAFNKIKPINEGAVECALGCKKLFFFEEGMKTGGFSEHFVSTLYEKGYKGEVNVTAIDGFVPHSTVNEALSELKLDSESIIAKVKGEN
ncbi:MAG: 1-deoxy-D-xylulose-5-phosphate synthase [Clostridia bacterium]|nr:1-deoxy-D-xylulose-5-phosphate synthase [Clostridia bacterium]